MSSSNQDKLENIFSNVMSNDEKDFIKEDDGNDVVLNNDEEY